MPNYDMTVMGAGLGGMTAAAILAKHRKKVVLLEPDAEPGGMHADVVRNGFRFSAGPSLMYGYEQGGALHALTGDLGISQHVSLISPSHQVVLPDRRITVYADHNETVEDLRREYPGEIDGIARCFRDIRKLSERCVKSPLMRAIASRRSAAAFLGRFRFSRELSAFFTVRSLAFFRSPVERLSLIELVQLVDLPPLHLQGGTGRLMGQLRDVILKNGGEFRSREPWPEIRMGKNRIVSVKTENDLITSRALLLNTVSGGHESILFLAAQETVVPVEMARNVICLPDYADPHSFFTLTLSSGEDEQSAPRGMRTITAVFSTGGNARPPATGGNREQIEKVIPFLSDFLVFTETPDFSGRNCPLPDGMESRQPHRNAGYHAVERTAARNIFLLPDGIGAPLRTVAAARRFAARFF